MSNVLVFVLELIGTAAFTVSGAIVGIKKQMDLFGVIVLGVCTAVGGGIVRDVILGITPPATFHDPVYTLTAAAVSVLMFLPHVRARVGRHEPVFDRLLLVMDAVGLGVFTVVGVQCAYRQAEHDTLFLTVFVGLITGVGGGVMRDLFAGDRPYIFVKHVYASFRYTMCLKSWTNQANGILTARVGRCICIRMKPQVTPLSLK